MAKNLVRRVIERARRTLLVATALAGLASCKECNPINLSPEFTTTPIVRVVEGDYYNYDADARDAENDTLEYSLARAPSWLSINSETGEFSGRAPFVTADTDEDISVEVSDGQNVVSQDYTLTIENVPTPENHVPVINSTAVTSVNENIAYSYNVDATDGDINPLTYSLAQSPDWLSINETTGIISGTSPEVDADTDFDVSVEVSDGFDSATQDYVLTVSDVVVLPVDNDFLDVSLQVFNNKTELPQKAKVKIFDSANEASPLDLVTTNSNGEFVYHSATKKISQLAGVTLTAVLVDDSGNPISYEHTLRYPAEDLTGVILKPHPKPEFASMEDYREHRRRTNIRTEIAPEDNKERGLIKFDWKGLLGIGRFTTNPLSGNTSAFTTGSGSQYEILKNKIKDSDDIEVLVRGSGLSDTDSNGFPDLDNFILEGEPQLGIHYEIIGGQIVEKLGYILVAPDNTLPSGRAGDTSVGYYQNSSLSGIMNRALIRINPNIENGDLFKRTVSHEFEHLINPYDLPTIDRPGDSTYPTYDEQTLSPTATILRYDTPNTTIGQGLADIEDAITNEDLYPSRVKLDDILKVPQPGDWN